MTQIKVKIVDTEPCESLLWRSEYAKEAFLESYGKCQLDSKQDRLFNRPFNQYRWTQTRDKVGLRDFKFHDLRKTFGSVLAQRGVSTAVIQRLLEHSSPDLTNKVYTNVDPVLRQAIDTMPVSDWLKS
jgi:integrase